MNHDNKISEEFVPRKRCVSVQTDNVTVDVTAKSHKITTANKDIQL